MPTQLSDLQTTLDLLHTDPWYAYAALRGLDLSPDAEERRYLADILSVCIGDPPTLSLLLGEEAADTGTLNPTAPASTADTIDAFIDLYGGTDRGLPPSVARLQELPPAEEASVADSGPSEEAPDVRELIKKGEYEAAIDIIKELNLNNPEKSIYFADQIRFLKKLIINRSKAGAGK